MTKYVPKVGDYVVHADLTLEEYRQFHNDAIAAGFKSYLDVIPECRYLQCEATLIAEERELAGTRHAYGTNNVTHLYKQSVDFTQDDLKNGMLVEYRNGDIRMVWGNSLLCNDLYLGASMDGFEDLNHEKHINLDIVAVYEHAGKSPTDFAKGSLLWKCPEETKTTKYTVTLELTDEQLEKIKQVIGG